MHHTKLLCDISELNHLFRDSVSIQSFLQQIVSLVQKHLGTDVCSIYLYDDVDKVLTLKATIGLSQDSIGNVSMKLGEGITGKALENKVVLNVSKAQEHPDFKAFTGINEELFECFLAVPVVRGIERIGVITLQRTANNPFIEVDEMACKAVASQIGNIIENARFMMAFEHSIDESEQRDQQAQQINSGKQFFVKGKSASKGLTLSKVKKYSKTRSFRNLIRGELEKQYGIEDLRRAVELTSSQLESLQQKVDNRLDDAASLIFSSHLLILKDKSFVGKIEKLIESGKNAPQAVVDVSQGYIDIFSSSDNIFIKEKAHDVEDIAERMINNMLSNFDVHSDIEGKVVIAKDLFPSELLKLTSENASGIVLVSGGVTSHLSILATSLGIPMVIANNPELLNVNDDTQILLDADAGNLYVSPEDDVLEQFEANIRAREDINSNDIEVDEHTITADGKEISIFANINLLSDVKLATKLKSRGVGLYRTEFPFIIRNNFPTEQEQYVVYSKLVERMGGKPVTFRTLDVEGDKMLSYYHDASEQNPAIGLRSIRFSLKERDIFIQQVRAILRAGFGSEIGIMFPMIGSLDEFDMAREIVAECMAGLTKDKCEFNPNPKIGIMIELPSVVEQIDEFAAEADFFSIGTNDFVQFMLGVDRTNELVEQFYMPHHPAVLRALDKIIRAADKAGKPVSMCGMMASDPSLTAFLIGIGLKQLSVLPASIPALQKQIKQLDTEKCARFAKELLLKSRATDIYEQLQKGI